MRKLLLVLLALLLIVLLSYYCFKSKTETIENHLLGSVQEIYVEESLDAVGVTLKGEDLRKTRILVLNGVLESQAEKEHAEIIAQNINGVYAVENNLIIKEKPINNILRIPETLKVEVELNLTKIEMPILKPPALEEVNSTAKKNKKLEELVASTTLLLSEMNNTQKSIPTIKEFSCEDSLNDKLSQEKINFEQNNGLIKKNSHGFLNELIEIIKLCSYESLSIEGHSDSFGSAQYNQWLSQKRANAVKAYFVKNGIKKEKLKARGYGEKNPMATNKTIAGRKLNRRIELKIKGVK